MAGGGNFIHRVMSYVANEIIVNGLANRTISKGGKEKAQMLTEICIYKGKGKGGGFMISSNLSGQIPLIKGNSPAFQRFAVRTSKRMEDLSAKAAQVKKEVAEQVKDISKNMESFKNQ